MLLCLCASVAKRQLHSQQFSSSSVCRKAALVYGSCSNFHSLLQFMALGSSPHMLPDILTPNNWPTFHCMICCCSSLAFYSQAVSFDSIPLWILIIPPPCLQQFPLLPSLRQLILGCSTVRTETTGVVRSKERSPWLPECLSRPVTRLKILINC